MNIAVREARLLDVPMLTDMGKLMHAESAFAPANWDTDKVKTFGKRILKDDNSCFFVATADSKPVGMVVGSIQEYFFGRDTELVDYIWYVLPEYRGTSAGVRLIKAFTEFGKQKKCKQIYVRIGTNVQTDRTGKLLERLNFTSVGGMFSKAGA